MFKLVCTTLCSLALGAFTPACAAVCTGDTEPSFFAQPELTNHRGTATRVSLDGLCAAMHGCPSRSKAMSNSIRVAGCGVESFQSRQGDLAGEQWNYDVDTGKLIGAARHGDYASIVDGCKAASFQAGVGPPLQASDGGVPDHAPHRESCDDVTVGR